MMRRAILLCIGCLWLGGAHVATAATCAATDETTLQSCLDAVNPGDTIQLTAGATFTGNFWVTRGGTAGNYVTITTTGTAPAAPTCNSTQATTATIQSCWDTWKASVSWPKMRVTGKDPALRFSKSINYIKVIGIEFVSDFENPSNYVSYVVQVGRGATGDYSVNDHITQAELPDHISWDRNYVHGLTSGNLYNGLDFNCTNCEIINGIVDDVHAVQGGESHGILITNGGHDYLLENNYVRAATIGIFFGGDPAEDLLGIPSDITVRGNYIAKKVSWKTDDPSYVSGCPSDPTNTTYTCRYLVKNIFESKNSNRMLVEKNLLEYNWSNAGDQRGFCILLTSSNQFGVQPDTTVSNTTVRYNVCRHSPTFFQQIGNYSSGNPALITVSSRNTLVENNLAYDIGGATWDNGGVALWTFQLAQGAHDYTIRHNTIDTAIQWGALIMQGSPAGGGLEYVDEGCTFSNNILKATDEIFRDEHIDNTAHYGTLATSHMCTGTVETRNNVFGEDVDNSYQNLPATTQTPLTTALNAEFVNRAGADYRLNPSSPYVAGGVSQASDGKNVGIESAAVWCLLPPGPWNDSGAGCSVSGPARRARIRQR